MPTDLFPGGRGAGLVDRCEFQDYGVVIQSAQSNTVHGWLFTAYLALNHIHLPPASLKARPGMSGGGPCPTLTRCSGNRGPVPSPGAAATEAPCPHLVQRQHRKHIQRHMRFTSSGASPISSTTFMMRTPLTVPYESQLDGRGVKEQVSGDCNVVPKSVNPVRHLTASENGDITPNSDGTIMASSDWGAPSSGALTTEPECATRRKSSGAEGEPRPSTTVPGLRGKITPAGNRGCV